MIKDKDFDLNQKNTQIELINESYLLLQKENEL